MSTGLAADLRALAQKVNASAPSVTKWHAFRNALAEALNVPEDDVYPTTVSKAGNLGVRGVQSGAASTASILVVMYTGSGGNDLVSTLAGLEGICRQGKQLGLIFDQAASWALVAIVKHVGATIPPVLAAEYPTASVSDV